MTLHLNSKYDIAEHAAATPGPIFPDLHLLIVVSFDVSEAQFANLKRIVCGASSLKSISIYLDNENTKGNPVDEVDVIGHFISHHAPGIAQLSVRLQGWHVDRLIPLNYLGDISHLTSLRHLTVTVKAIVESLHDYELRPNVRSLHAILPPSPRTFFIDEPGHLLEPYPFFSHPKLEKIDSRAISRPLLTELKRVMESRKFDALEKVATNSENIAASAFGRTPIGWYSDRFSPRDVDDRNDNVYVERFKYWFRRIR